jgi:hypothetical protein
MQIAGETPDFDEIGLNIMPLLKNGTTPERQTILNVLESIAEHTTSGKWRLKSDEQPGLFGLLH